MEQETTEIQETQSVPKERFDEINGRLQDVTKQVDFLQQQLTLERANRPAPEPPKPKPIFEGRDAEDFLSIGDVSTLEKNLTERIVSQVGKMIEPLAMQAQYPDAKTLLPKAMPKFMSDPDLGPALQSGNPGNVATAALLKLARAEMKAGNTEGAKALAEQAEVIKKEAQMKVEASQRPQSAGGVSGQTAVDEASRINTMSSEEFQEYVAKCRA